MQRASDRHDGFVILEMGDNQEIYLPKIKELAHGGSAVTHDKLRETIKSAVI